MSDNKKSVVIAFIMALVICVLSISLVACSKYVYADELSNNAILNFNQYFNGGSNYSVVSTTTSRTNIYNQTSFNVEKGHYYYIGNSANNNIVALSLVRYNNGVYVNYSDYFIDSIAYNNSNYNQIAIQVNTVGLVNGNFNFIVVDLTQMFGTGNEPTTVEEVKSYLPLDYYSYTIGTPISNEYIRGYQDGVSDSMNSYKYTVAANDSYNNLVPFGNNVVMDKSIISGRYANTFSNSVDSNGSKVAYFGFADNTLSSGSKLTLQGYCLQNVTSPEGVDVAVLVGQEYIVVGHLNAARESWLYNTISFTLPYASNGIYFVGKGYGGFTLADFVVEIETSDYDVLYGLAYQRGVDSVNTHIYYENGYNAGLVANNPYTFRSLIGSVLDAPVQAVTGLLDFDILGVNMKGLYLSLFTLALIIAITKLALGK